MAGRSRRVGLLCATGLGLVVGACGRPTTNAGANATVAAPAAAPLVAATVPFVGCAQDGQGGPQAAPSGAPKAIQADAQSANALAYYSNGANGVLAPRGWYCFGVYGSDGSILYVAPTPVQFADVTASAWKAGAGDAIEASWMSGDTSGRFAVAKVIARVFPGHQGFVQKVIAEGIEPATDFPYGPFPGDHVTNRSDTVVEYQTPAGMQGLGISASNLTPSADPVTGVAILQGATPDLAFLAAKLPAGQQALAATIVRQLEVDSATPTPAPSDASAAPTVTPPPAAASPAAAGPTTALGVVQSFYAALNRADGATASGLVIPEKRASGAYSAAALTQFYGGMSQPVQLVSATPEGPDTIAVRYTYVYAGGRACNGAAEVRTVQSGGGRLIAAIRALNGC